MPDADRPDIDLSLSEAPVGYTTAGGRIGVPSIFSLIRTQLDMIAWLGVAPLAPRLLSRLGAQRASAHVQRLWARGISRSLRLSIQRDGLDHIDPKETYVVISLHEGFADILALLQLPLDMRFVVRDELADWPLLGGYIRDTRQVIIRPEAGLAAYRQIVRQAREVFAAGEHLVIFPQGSILGIEAAFFRGAFDLARILERPILPIALTGSHRVWEYPYGPRLRRGQRMSLRILPPVPFETLNAQGVESTRRMVQAQMKQTALDGSMTAPRRFVPAWDGYWDGYSYEIDPAFPELAADVARHREGIRGKNA